MATALTPQEKKFKDMLTCPICLEQFTDPKVLPCLHTFCLGCVDTWATKNQIGKKLPCPICKEEMVVPEGGLKAIKPNFLLNTLQEVLQSTTDQGEQTVKQRTDRSIYCEKHPQEVLVCYCTKDDCAICGKCLSTEHAKHPCSNINDEAKKDKNQIATLLAIAVSRHHVLKALLNNFTGSKQSDKLKLRINQDRFRVLEHVQDYYDKQVKEVDAHHAENTSLFQKQIQELENSIQYLTSLQDHGHAIMIVNLRKELNKKLEVWTKEGATAANAIEATENKYNFLPASVMRGDQFSSELLTLGKLLRKTDITPTSTLYTAERASIVDHPKEDLYGSDDEFMDCFESIQETEKKGGKQEEMYERQSKNDECQTKTEQLIKPQVKDQTTSSAIAEKAKTKEHLDDTDKEGLAKSQPDEKDSHILSGVKELSIPQKKNRRKSYGIKSIAVKTNGDLAFLRNDEDEVDVCDQELTMIKVTLRDYEGYGVRSVIPLVGDCLGSLDSNSTINVYGSSNVHRKQIDIKKSIGNEMVPDIRNVAVFNDGSIAALNEERVQRINSYSGKPIRYFKIRMKDPVSLTVNSEDIVIIVDKGSHSIKGFHMMSGHPALSYGKEGKGTGELSFPNDACTDTDDNIIIADTGNKRVHLLDPRGKFKKYILNCEESPLSVAIDNDGHLLCGTDVGKIYSVNYD